MNSVHKYTSTLSIIYDKLDIVRRYGEDVSLFEEKINNAISIAESTSDEVRPIEGVAVQTLNNDSKYTEALSLLKEIENDLDEYTKYLVVHFKNKSLENELSKGVSIDKTALNNYVSQVISLIKDVKNVNIRSLSKGRELVRDVYKTAYEIIKLELIKNGESKLLNQIVKNNLGIEFINDFVREDLKSIDLENEENSDIKYRIDELSSDGINYSYADERLILSILLKNDPRLLDNIDIKLEEIEAKLNKLHDDKKELNSSTHDLEDLREVYGKKIKTSRLKSLVMSILVLLNLGTYKISKSVVKKDCTDIVYMTTREVYDTVTGEVKSVSDFEYKYGDNDVILKKYGEVKRNGSREVKTYDLDDVELDSIEDYVDYDLSNISTTSTSTSYIEYSMAEQLSKDSYTIVETKRYSEEPKIDFDEEKYNNDIKKWMYLLISLDSVEALALLRYLIIVLNNKRKNNKLRKTMGTIEYQKQEIYTEEEKAKEKKNELRKLKDKYMYERVDVDEYALKVYNKHISKNKKK